MTFLATSLRPLHRRVRARRARLASDVAERLPHGPELRLLGRIERERSRLGRRSAGLITAAVRRARASGMLQAAPEAASGVAAASVLAAALAADLPSGHAAAALAALGILSGTLRDLAGCWNRRQAWLVARRRCEALFETRPLKHARPSQPPLSGAALPVRFRGVTAGPLRKIDLEVAPGARVAVVGPNGAGKSTLLSLAAGLESPRAGKVTVGGRSPLALGPAERRLIHRSAPDSLILAGSLRRALTMGSARRQDDAAVLARAEEFGLGPVLLRLGGLDGRVAEQARNLSSGEAQRIRLARAALSGARLLLLDEPETGLDSDAARLVLKLLDSLGSTCVMATHDMELARSMDELWEVSGASIHSDRRAKGSPIDQTAVPASA